MTDAEVATGFSMEAIGERLRTQDGRMTSEPMFLVEEKQRLYGVDTNCDPPIAWLYDDEAVEVDFTEGARLEKAYQETGDDSPDGYRRVGYADRWEFVTCCLTEVGAQTFIDRHSHRFKGELRIYVDSGHRNDEWIALREHLRGGR